MSSTAIRAWYCATGVNGARPLTSPAAHTPSTLVRMRPSTTMPARLVSTPSSLLATVNGRAVPIPGGAHGVRLLVTPRTIVRAPKTA